MTVDTLKVNLRVTPGAKTTLVGGSWDDPDMGPRLIVKVTAPPEDGKANQAVIKAIAKTLGLAKSRLEITAGHTNRHKTLEISEPDEALRQKIGDLLGA